ncbi:MAG: hypothetical protein D6740_01555 [Alphaproteobacteria bacterium]|nr:MAG: hypothetical protein D6740_01555 [Alphaproteobacteria bacterium]
MRKIFLSCVLVCLLVFIGVYSVPFGGGIDWYDVFRPAGEAILQGRSPYAVDGFYNPFWGALIAVPFAMLPEPLGRGVWFAVSFLLYAVAAVRFGARRGALAAFMVSPVVVQGLHNGNVDALVLLGMGLPGAAGVWLAMLKPQISAGMLLWWGFDGVRKRDFGTVCALVACVALAVVTGWHPWEWVAALEVTRWNVSLFPAGVPVGLGMVTTAVCRDDVQAARAAGGWLSPYMTFHSWVGAMTMALNDTRVAIAVCAGLWFVVWMWI